jgi:hypothetical protein
MGTVRRLFGALAVLSVISVFALRPLLSIPGAASLLENGLSDRRTLLVLPLVLTAIIVAVLRVNTLLDDDDDPTETQFQPVEKNSWSEDELRDEPDGSDLPGNSAVLGGQGGARDRDFEIEEEPPDAHLAGHLEHLEEELGDDEDLRHDLETLEEVIEESGDSGNVPARCPYEHCGAAWRERGIVGLNSDRYELLDDGTTVVCLECERTVSLD